MRSALEVAARILTARAPTPRPAAFVAWHRLRYQDAERLRAELIEAYKPATARKVLSAFRGIVRSAWRLGHLTADQAERLADVGAVRGRTLPAGRTLGRSELEALVRACYNFIPQALGRRDAAAILLMYAAGLRREEVRRLDLDSLDLVAGAVKVLGKGNKERTVPLRVEVLEALEVWLEFRGDEPGPLFTKYGDGLDRLSLSAYNRIVTKHAERAKLDHLTPHDLRRTFVTALLEAEVDVLRVRELAGHEDLETTARYDRRGDDANRAALERLPIPRFNFPPTGAGRSSTRRGHNERNVLSQLSPETRNSARQKNKSTSVDETNPAADPAGVSSQEEAK
jgi:integrase